jgi:hypothetical protein
MKRAFMILLFALCLILFLLAWRYGTLCRYRLKLLEKSLSVWYKPIAVTDIQIYGESLVQDGDYEDADTSSWFSVDPSTKWKIEDGIGQEGSRALHLCSANGDSASVSQRICFLVPPPVVHASCWIRSENKDTCSSCLMVEVEQFYNPYDENQESSYGAPFFISPSINGDPNWKKIEVVAPLHPDTKSIVIRCLTHCSEKSVFIDNVEVFAAYKKTSLKVLTKEK